MKRHRLTKVQKDYVGRLKARVAKGLQTDKELKSIQLLTKHGVRWVPEPAAPNPGDPQHPFRGDVLVPPWADGGYPFGTVLEIRSHDEAMKDPARWAAFAAAGCGASS